MKNNLRKLVRFYLLFLFVDESEHLQVVELYCKNVLYLCRLIICYE